MADVLALLSATGATRIRLAAQAVTIALLSRALVDQGWSSARRIRHNARATMLSPRQGVSLWAGHAMQPATLPGAGAGTSNRESPSSRTPEHVDRAGPRSRDHA